MKEKIITSFILDKNDYKEFKLIANEKEKSISFLIRELIKKEIEKQKRKINVASWET